MYVYLKYLLLVLHQPHRDLERATPLGRKPKSSAHGDVLVPFLYHQDEQLLAVKKLIIILVPEVPNPKRNVVFSDLLLPPLTSAELLRI